MGHMGQGKVHDVQVRCSRVSQNFQNKKNSHGSGQRKKKAVPGRHGEGHFYGANGIEADYRGCKASWIRSVTS